MNFKENRLKWPRYIPAFVGCCRKMKLYPKERDSRTGSHLSLYLVLADLKSLTPASKIYVDYALRIQDQVQTRDISAKSKALSFAWIINLTKTVFKPGLGIRPQLAVKPIIRWSDQITVQISIHTMCICGLLGSTIGKSNVQQKIGLTQIG